MTNRINIPVSLGQGLQDPAVTKMFHHFRSEIFQLEKIRKEEELKMTCFNVFLIIFPILAEAISQIWPNFTNSFGTFQNFYFGDFSRH